MLRLLPLLPPPVILLLCKAASSPSQSICYSIPVLFIHLVYSQGAIEVHATIGGSFQGYVSKSYDALNLYTLSTDPNNAQTFSLPSADHFNKAIDINSVNGPSPSAPLLGPVGFSEFGSGQSGFAYLAGVTHSSLSFIRSISNILISSG